LGLGHVELPPGGLLECEKLQIPLNPPLKKGDFKEAAVFPPLL
jgi:hypothetical protein